jgi:predicted DNA-binding protein
MSAYSTRSIRIENEYDEILRSDADKNGLRVNSIIRDLIEAYVNNGRIFGNDYLITTSITITSSLVENLDEERVIQAGRKAGSMDARNNLLSRGMSLDYESLKWFIIEVLSKHNNWFNCNFNEVGNMYMFHLRHNLHINWSLFVQAYLEAMVRDIMNLEVDAEIMDGSITLRIPIKEAI